MSQPGYRTDFRSALLATAVPGSTYPTRLFGVYVTNPNAVSIWITVATVINVSAALASATHHSVLMDGIVRISAAGTFIPQYQWSAAPGVAGVTLRDSYFMLNPIGTQSVAAVGAWA